MVGVARLRWRGAFCMKSHYLRFKKWIEKKKIQRYLNNLRVGGIIALGLLFIILVISLVAKDSGLILGTKTSQESVPTIDISNISASESPTPTSTPIPDTPTPFPTAKPTIYVDPDPVEPCTSKNSGDSIKVKRSECQNMYVDCQINNTWKILTKEECTKEQNA